MTAVRASSSTRSRSAGESDSQRPSFSASSRSTTSSPRVRSAASVGITSSEPSQPAKRLDLLLDDALGLARLGPAHELVARDLALQVVDVGERHAGQLGARRVDVARHREVDQQQRPPGARGHHHRELLGAEDQVRRGGGGDDDVGPRELVGQRVERDRRRRRSAAPARSRARAGGWRRTSSRTPCSCSARAVPSAVSPAPMMSDVAAAEVAERVAGGVDGDGGDAGAADGDGGVGAHALAGRQRGAEELVGQRAGGLGRERRLVGALDLALDLGLADDHRLEAAGHAVEMSRRVAVAQRVDPFEQLGRPDAGAARERGRARRSRPRRRRRPRGRARCGCRSRGRPPRRSSSPTSSRIRRSAPASVSAIRSRTATPAVLCDAPSASSSLIAAPPRARVASSAAAAARRPSTRSRARPARARSAPASTAMIAT